MDGNGKIRTIFFVVWLVLLAGVGGLLLRQEQFLAAADKPIARLVEKAGTVQVRAEGLVDWSDTVVKQSFFDGDRIATERNAKAEVAFGKAHAISLGGETQIQITAVTQTARDHAYVVTLLRGTLVAKVDKSCASCAAIVVRAGRDTFNVGVGEKMGFFKPLGQKAKPFDPKGPWPSPRRDVAADAPPSQSAPTKPQVLPAPKPTLRPNPNAVSPAQTPAPKPAPTAKPATTPAPKPVWNSSVAPATLPKKTPSPTLAPVPKPTSAPLPIPAFKPAPKILPLLKPSSIDVPQEEDMYGKQGG